MDKLWAPWRIKYVSQKKKSKGCIFCRAKNKNARDFVIFKTKKSICLLNIYPYNNGHLLVSPLRHLSKLEQLTKEEILDLFSVLTRAQRLLQIVLKPQGYNLGLNLTRAAGAGITGHLHIHIVPRWVGDVNFMPAVCGTKVISQSLEELAKLLKNADQ